MHDKTLDILNCAASGKVAFHFVCPVGWEALEDTGDPRRRRCPSCQRDVHRCVNIVDAALRAEQGECIAVPAWLARGARDARGTDRLIIGQPRSTLRLFQELEARREDTPQEETT
jgi:hypothetical protein